MVQRKDNPLARSEGIKDFLERTLTTQDDENQEAWRGQVAALVAGYYIRTPWSDGELMNLCLAKRKGARIYGVSTTLRDLLAALKLEGERPLREVDESAPG